MIRLGNSARFTPTEVEEFRHIGLDLGAVRRSRPCLRKVLLGIGHSCPVGQIILPLMPKAPLFERHFGLS
jgi:hypothetical protein